MNELQQDEYDILCAIDDICKKHSIPYILIYGTLLGAVRDGGFIPWDDDIDIAMTRSDYLRFAEVAATELKKPLVLQTMETEECYHSLLPKIRNTDKPLTEYAHRYLDISSGVWVDIFIFDKVPEDDGERNEFSNALAKMYHKLHRNLLIFAKPSQDGFVKTQVKRIVDVFNRLKYPCFKRSYINLCKQIEEKRKTYDATNTKLLADLCLFSSVRGMNSYLLFEDDFKDTILKEFEQRSFPIPRRYDDILKAAYGNYMDYPPQEERENIHYFI